MSDRNVLLIVSDDQGPWALGCAGNTEIHTPHLDRLAEQGVRFDNFFCTSPVCSPARASLFTGKMPSQHGVHDWITGSQVEQDSPDFLAGHTLITDILAEQGWRTGISGKWHLGAANVPRDGVDHWFVHQRGGGPYYDAPMVRGTECFVAPGYVTDVITDDALAFLDEGSADDRPFFLAVCYTAPHRPWADNHPREYVDLYNDCAFTTCPQEPAHPWLRQRRGHAAGGEADRRAALQGYYAAVTAMDAGIGRLLAQLERTARLEDTLVVFVSDNGFNCGHHGIWGKGNGTYPLNMYDSSVKVPAIFSQPSRIRSGHVARELVSAYDLVPTLLDHLDLHDELPDGLPGRSLRDLLTGSADGDGFDRIVVYDEYGPTRMIRTAEWKYVRRHPSGPDELYHLVDDPDERHNLVTDPTHADVLAELARQLAQWFSEHSAPAIDGLAQPVTGLGQLRPVTDQEGESFRQFPANDGST